MADIGSPNFRPEENLWSKETTSKVSTEILIIGGGIAGTSTAYYLSQYGHGVTLLERGEIAGEALGLNAGNLWATGWGRRPTRTSTMNMGGLELLKALKSDPAQEDEYLHSGSV